ncbi:MAG TPA: ACT domain-containing protein [Clostridia bacterium]|nr:ACT domain-containing protein [Clostridia bacterium]
MPANKEFSVRMEDKPGTLGKFCRALAERGVNIVAFEAWPAQWNSEVRLVVDNPQSAKTALDNHKVDYSERDVALVKIPHRPGELARAASQLGDASINVDYAYGGVEPTTNSPMLIFGVADVSKAVKVLDEAFSKAA